MRVLVLIFFSLMLAGCVASVRSDVTRFHSLDNDDWKGKKIYLISANSSQGNKPESQHYTKEISNQLIQQGFVITTSKKNADYMASFSYMISEPKTNIDSAPVFGQTVTGYQGNSYGFGNWTNTTISPTYGVDVKGYRNYTYQTYIRSLVLMITPVDRRGGAKPELVFQGTVTSEGESGNIATVMPAMIKAMFDDFPGESGKPVRKSKAIQK